MPTFVTPSTEIDYTAQQQMKAAPISQADNDYVTKYRQGMDRSLLSTTSSFAVGATLDLIDTAASSVIPGVERQDVNNKILSAVGAPGFNKWFHDNQGSLELGSGIAGTVISAWGAGKLLNGTGKAMGALRGVPFVGKVAQLDSRYEKALQLARITETQAAKAGAMGVDRFVAESMTLPQLGRAGIQMTTGKAAKGVYGAGLTRGLAHNVATEAIMATFLHSNSMLYSDDLAHNIAWSAAGLGFGASIDMLTSTYALRKVANSAEVRQANRAAFDRSGLESQRIGAFGTADAIRRAADGEAVANTSWQVGNRSSFSDEVTSIALQASELAKTPGQGATNRAKRLFGRSEPLATQYWEQAQEGINKITTHGLRGVSETRAGTKLEGFGAPLNQSVYKEPTSLYGMNEIGTVPEGWTRQQTIEARQRALDSAFNTHMEVMQNGGKWTRRKVKTPDGEVFEDRLVPLKEGEADAIRAELLELHDARTLVPQTMLEPGEWSPMSWGKIADGYEPREIQVAGGLGRDDIAEWFAKSEKGKPRIGLTSDGQIHLPNLARGKVENLSSEDALQYYNVANRAVRDMAKSEMTLTLPKNPSWAQLDLAEQLIKATDDPSKVKFPGSMTREEAMIESFAQKTDILKSKAAQNRNNVRRNVGLPLDDADAFALKTHLNLPRLTPYQHGLMNSGEHPIDILLHGLESGKQVRDMSYQDLLKTLNDARVITGFTDTAKPSLDNLSGNSFNFLRDLDGNPMKPIIGMKRPMRPTEYAKDTLFTRQAMTEMHVRDSLLGETADANTKRIMDGLVTDPAFSAARNVTELADTQSRSFVPGFTSSAPQEATGSFMNSITSRARRDVDNMTMRAASMIQESKTRLMQQTAKDIFDRNLGDLPTVLGSARNTRSKMLVDQFISFRSGWEIGVKPKEIALPNGEKGFTFVLDHEHIGNQRRFQQMFDKPLEKGQELLAPNGNPIVLDQMALDTRIRMQAVHKERLDMQNSLLRSQGLPEIKETPWYVAPPQDKNKYVEYAYDIAGQVVPGMKISAETPRELANLKQEVMKTAQWKDGYTFKSRDDTINFMTLWDKAQAEWIAPGTTAVMPNKRNFGISGGNLHNAKAFEEELASTLNGILKHGDDMIDVLYDPVIKAARARAAVAKEATRVGSRKAVEHSSVYDRFLQNLTGRSSLSAKDSFFGNAYEWAETRINGLLSSGPAMEAGAVARAGADKVADAFGTFIRAANPFDKQQISRPTFDKLATELGNYMPFKSASEMAAREAESHMPAELAKITNKLSWFEAASRLRWFESMHAIVNFGSMVSNMPSVIRALQPMKGETAAEAALRNGSLTMLMNVGSKDQVVLPNSMRLLWESMRDAQKALPDEFTSKAVARGFMGQEVAELNRGFDAIKSKTGFDKFMFGDPNAKSKLGRAGLDGAMDILSTRSEDFTRAWGMYAGRRVAKAMGIHNVDEQLSFSHGLVNELIANYDPRNRPEIFQGALGAPLGLFQSYTLNFYQRMFRYIETGNTRAAATQYATQSAIFGTSSLPGWNQVNWAFFDHGQGKTGPDGEYADPLESLEHRLGKDAADLYMHGLLSNLPKLFGADGMALYTRGDTQFRSPVNPLNLVRGDATISIPITDTFSRLFNGVGQAVDQLRAMEGKIGLNQVAEIASNVITNRPLAGAIEMLGAGGYDTDSSGQVAAKANLASAAGAYRILGTRSMAQQKSVEQFYQSRNAQEEQGARQDVLNIATRQAIRDERYDDIPALFAKYVDEGGKPQYYSAWIKRQFDSGLNTRSERLLTKALNDKGNQSNNYIARLIDGEVDMAEDEENTDDYGAQAARDQLIQDGWDKEPTSKGLADPLNDSTDQIRGW